MTGEKSAVSIPTLPMIAGVGVTKPSFLPCGRVDIGALRRRKLIEAAIAVAHVDLIGRE